MTLAKRAAPILLLGLIAVLAWFYHHHNNRGVSVCMVGQASNRLQGIVPAELRGKHLDARYIQSAVGNVALLGWPSLGDGMVLQQQAWLRTTNRNSPKFYDVLRNRYFQSNYLVFLPSGTRVVKRWNTDHSTDVQTVWSSLARTYGEGVYISGYIHFKKLNTIAIARPAIDTRPVLDDPARYYTQPMQTAENTWGYVIAVVARRKPRFWWQQRQHVKRMIPVDNSNTWYIALAQVMILDGQPDNPTRPPTAAQVRSFGQLVASSEIDRIRLALYPVARAMDCPAVFY